MHSESPDLLSRKVIEHAPMSMAIVGLDGTIEYINQKAIDTFGYLPADIPTMAQWWALAYPDEQYRTQVIARWTGLVAPALAEGREIPRSDYQVTCKDGTVKTVGLFGVPVEGKLLVMFDHITERQRTDQRLRESEANFRTVLEASLDVAYRRDVQRDRCDYMSPSIETISGYSAAEFSSMSFATVEEHVHPDDRHLAQERLRRGLAGESVSGTFEYRFRHKDGTYRWFCDSGKLVLDAAGAPLYHIGIVRDVTERKRTEQRLRESEANFRTVLESSLDVAYRRDLKRDRYDYLSPSIESISGLTVAEFSGLCFAEVQEHFHPDDRPALQERVRRSQAGEPIKGTFEYRFRHKDGSYHWFSDCSTAVADATGTPLYHVGIVRDVTERKQLEAASRANERRLTALLNASTEPIMLLDPDGLILTLNQAMSHRIGKPPAELLGAFAPGFLDAALGQARFAHVKEVVQSGQTLRFEDEKQGRYFDNNLYPVVDEAGRVLAVAVFSSDITARKQAELTLQQANVALESKVHERTAQLRALASELTLAEQRERKRIAGVLHDDLQQLLIAARFNLGGLAQSKHQPTQQLVAQVDDLIAQSVKRSRLLSVELSPPILQLGGLVPALEWLASWMEANHGLSVSFSVHGRGVPQQEDVAALLFQVTRELLLNVVKHARVKTAAVEIVQNQRTFRISVADQGVGFDPAQLATRPANATGFGLLGIRDRLDLLGGRMEIVSAPGQGSRFTLTAPGAVVKAARSTVRVVRKEKKSLHPVAPVRTGPASTGSRQKIRLLIVDDHKLVRQAFAQLLNGTADIQVVGEAASGEEALALLETLPLEIVTMDINMKGMDGIEATRHIRARFPQIRVVGLSMFEEEERAQAMRAAGACDYLAKSSPATHLLTAIRRAARTPAAS